VQVIDFPIIDSHIHLLDRKRFDYSWSAGSTWAASAVKLNRDWLLDDLSSYVKPYRIEAFVFIEADVDMPHYMDEVRWVESLANRDRRMQGSVACIPLELGTQIESQLRDISMLPHVRGVRRLIQNLPDHKVILTPPFLNALNLLPRYGLTFDICVYEHQLPAVVRMVSACPDVSFVLNHAGKPDIKSNRFRPWADDVRDLAQYPNVVCKLSGLLTQANHATWNPEQLLPYIQHIFESFGVDRVMFGGDWPVLELAACYREWVDLVDLATDGMSRSERRKIFRGNAIRTYRLDVEEMPAPPV
jgi:L-fuconolactonase